MTDRKPSAAVIPDNDLNESILDTSVKLASRAKGSTTSTVFKVANSTYEDQETLEESLRQELANVRKVNETIEGVIQSLERAKGNMETVNQTVGAASSLLNTWTRILSQTEYNQRLILDPAWQGASQDMADIETEAVAKQEAAARREAEEQERKTAAAKRIEEEEKRRAVENTKSQKASMKARGRTTSRGAAASGYVADSSANTSMSSVARGTSGSRRTTSGISRGRGGRSRV